MCSCRNLTLLVHSYLIFLWFSFLKFKLILWFGKWILPVKFFPSIGFVSISIWWESKCNFLASRLLKHHWLHYNSTESKIQRFIAIVVLHFYLKWIILKVISLIRTSLFSCIQHLPVLLFSLKILVSHNCILINLVDLKEKKTEMEWNRVVVWIIMSRHYYKTNLE